MLLQYKGIEPGVPGEPARQVARGTEKEMHTDGEVGGMKQRTTPALERA